MVSPPAPYLMVSKTGIAVGLALLAFGAYTTVTYFTRGGHGMTMLRGLAALPLAAAAIYLSFGWGCSTCGTALERSGLDTSPRDALALTQAAASGDGAGAGRVLTAARQDQGRAHVSVEFCQKCRRLARVRVRGADAEANGTHTVAGDVAGPLVEAAAALSADSH